MPNLGSYMASLERNQVASAGSMPKRTAVVGVRLGGAVGAAVAVVILGIGS